MKHETQNTEHVTQNTEHRASMLHVICYMVCVFYLLISLSSAHAQEKAQAEEVNVSAQVGSPVSKEQSYITVNTAETLADPVNHPILLTIYVLDSQKQPLADKDVIITSYRGNVDIIEATSKISQYQVHAAEISAMQKDKTDSEGKVSFRVTSFIPGQAILTAKADLVELKPQTVKFISLPFPANLTISVAMPFSPKEWTIFSPRLQEENLSSLQKETKTLTNPGTKIKLNFWVVFFIFALLILSPLFIILNFANLKKLRKTEKEEIELLKKISSSSSSSSSDIRQLKDEIKKDGFDHDGILDQDVKTPPPK